mmetsp:Transcript_1468/g.2082  ORF Transcript_1468/g.2082 Transcript_1468/m.2082 type:complete len:273 (-) Transcript_1468:514-1332(-)
MSTTTVDSKKEQLLKQNANLQEFAVKGGFVGLRNTDILLMKFFAEFIAMLLFVFVGCGAAVSTAGAADSGNASWVHGVAFSFGLAITALAYAIGHITGGHINCAVTIGCMIAGVTSVLDGIVIIIAQILGAIVGAACLGGVFNKSNDATGALGANEISDNFGYGSAFLGEAMMTFLLFFVVAETALRNRLDYNPETKQNGVGSNAPIAIGFAVFLAHMVLIPVDGCSINPTRSFGPLVIASARGLPEGSKHWEGFPIFLFGPIVGASVAAIM